MGRTLSPGSARAKGVDRLLLAGATAYPGAAVERAVAAVATLTNGLHTVCLALVLRDAAYAPTLRRGVRREAGKHAVTERPQGTSHMLPPISCSLPTLAGDHRIHPTRVAAPTVRCTSNRRAGRLWNPATGRDGDRRPPRVMSGMWLPWCVAASRTLSAPCVRAQPMADTKGRRDTWGDPNWLAVPGPLGDEIYNVPRR
jgi:hypothetical protein